MRDAKKDLADVHAKGLSSQEEVDAETRQLISAGTGTDEQAAVEVISKADEDRRKRLEERRAAMKAKQAEYLKGLKDEKDSFLNELNDKDLVAEEEAEKKRVAALIENDLYDKREQEKEEEKKKDATYNIQQAADHSLQAASLLDKLGAGGVDVDALLEAQRNAEAEKMAARRALLMKRRRNKKNQEIEQKRLEDKVKALEEQDKVEEEVTEQYVRDLLEDAVKANEVKLTDDTESDSIARTDTMRRNAVAEKDDAKKRKERFMNLLNEKIADGD